ncbi:hypothetical protein MOV61_07990 [Neorhizobium sp. BETTINA12A]|uniref:hypothetical protein n=1 Tax=unclassified Neorhizobium TaxID=2629175 RepID=UPI00155F3B69|nr:MULTISPECIES: hypothetical protein [unclassified Neorhizobium]MCJ9750659.1 hypothetical protein [Neorhizobium sp. BETTINA12A]
MSAASSGFPHMLSFAVLLTTVTLLGVGIALYKHVIPGEYSPVNKTFSRKPRVGSVTRRDRQLAEADAA